MSNRIGPIGSLFLLSPFIAEYVLGNLPAKAMVLILPLGLMYGTGAIFIRELVRQTGRGWLTMMLLAVAYGFVEEGLVTQSLFNPDYMHFRLLDYGYIPALGIGLPWTIYVVTIHVCWSICVPIGLVECLFSARLRTPWLKKTGLIISGVAFVVGSTMVAFGSQKQAPYMASAPQLLGILILVAALVVMAFRVPKPTASTTNSKPHPAALFLAPFVCGSLLMVLQLFAEKTWHWAWQYTVISVLPIAAAFIAFMHFAARDKQWTPHHQWMLMAGGISVYLWFGFVLDHFMQGAAGFTGHAIVAAVALALVIVAFFKTKPATQRPDAGETVVEYKVGVSR
jgi:hypothetical protein